MCPRTKASFPRRVYLIQQPEQAVSGVVRGGAQRIQEPIPRRATSTTKIVSLLRHWAESDLVG